MGVYDQIKSAFQDIIAPELHAIRSDIQRLDQKIDGADARLNTKLDGLKAELLSEIRRLDARIDAIDRHVQAAIHSILQIANCRFQISTWPFAIRNLQSAIFN